MENCLKNGINLGVVILKKLCTFKKIFCRIIIVKINLLWNSYVNRWVSLSGPRDKDKKVLLQFCGQKGYGKLDVKRVSGEFCKVSWQRKTPYAQHPIILQARHRTLHIISWIEKDNDSWKNK